MKEAVPDTPVFANTGVRLANIEEQLAMADGAVVGTTFKRDGYIWNEVDVDAREGVHEEGEGLPEGTVRPAWTRAGSRLGELLVN